MRYRLLLTVLCLWLPASTASALKIEFTGTVETVASRAPTPVSVGMAVTGRIVLDRSIADVEAALDRGLFPGAVQVFDLHIGPSSWSLTDPGSPLNFFNVYDDGLGAPVDHVTMGASLTGTPLPGVGPIAAQIGFFSRDTSLLSSDRFPTADELNRLWAVDEANLGLNRMIRSGFPIQWRLDSFLATPIPEPGAAGLFAVGLAIARFSVRRRDRSLEDR